MTEIPFHFNPEWYYFPISEKTEKPLKGWQAISSNKPEDIARWKQRWPKSLYGLDCGKSGLTVLDVDNKNGKSGDAVVSRLQLDNEVLPKSFTVSTPSGGRHIYYIGKTKNRVALTAPGLDVRSVGGYVIAPGCVKKGKEYKVLSDVKPSFAPGWLLSAIGQPNTHDAQSQTPLVEYDLPHNVQKAMDYLVHSAPEALEGERDATCYKVACRVRDFGISCDMAKDLITDYYSDKVSLNPEFTVETMMLKVDAAYSYACDRPGNDTQEGAAIRASEAFAAISGEDLPPGQEFEEALPDSSWIPMGAFIGRPAPEREWIIEGWLPAGFSTPTLITGDGGTGKSLLAMQLAIAVACGGSWMSMDVKRQMQVAMVMCEDSEDELHRRVENIQNSSLGAFNDLTTANVNFMSRVGKDCVLCREDNGILKDGPFMLELHQQLKILGAGEKLLVIDTAADIYAGNESNRTSVTHFIKYKLCGLAKLHNATIIIIAHPPKSGSTYSGSTAWNNSVRNRLYLSWQNEKDKNDYRILSVEKSNYAQSGTKQVLKWNRGVLEAVDTSRMSSVIEEILYNEIKAFNENETKEGSDALLSMKKNSKNCITRRIISDPKTGRRLTISEIRDAVSRLVDQGRIVELSSAKRRGLICLEEDF